MPEIKLYTIKDLRNWLIENNPPAGLSEQVIAPVRAYAILNNPFAQEDDAVIATIFERQELAAFTACFPDIVDGNRIWWASTLWCNPKFQGKGYGLIVVGSLLEAHDNELMLDRWGANETVEIFNRLGYGTLYTPRFILGEKEINRKTLKGKLAYCIQEINKNLHSNYCHPNTTPYSLKYSTFVDGETYLFMQAHRNNNLFMREQTMLNWLLRYPFKQTCIMQNRVYKDTEFTSNCPSYGNWVVKVFCKGSLIGVYILRRSSTQLSVVYLYNTEEEKTIVYASIVEHICKIQINTFVTEDRDLAEFVQQFIYYPKRTIDQISFSCPHCFMEKLLAGTTERDYSFQLGDGDSFA